MSEKTVAQHLADSKALAQTIADANALVIKLQEQLQEARQVLELLGEWQHPKMQIAPLYGRWASDTKSLTGAQITAIEIKRINALLGDRA